MKSKRRESLKEKSRLYFLVSLCFVLFISLVFIENKTFYAYDKDAPMVIVQQHFIEEKPQLSSFQKDKPSPKKRKKVNLDKIPKKTTDDNTKQEPDLDFIKDLFNSNKTNNNAASIEDIDDISKTETIETVPYNRVSKAPIFNGCEHLSSLEDQKKCMNQKIASLVSKGLRPNLTSKDSDIRIYVQFTVDENGLVKEVNANSKSNFLTRKTKKIIESLPQFSPAEHNSHKVKVIYSLPVLIKVD